MIKLSPSRLQVAVLLLCFVATSLARDQRKCHQPTEFTIFDPNNPEGPVTCKTCPRCPAGQGLPVQCGSRVAIGTPTDCVPCKAETFSESEDVSHCKPCTICGKKVVLQQCTPKQNRECGDCLPGYYLDHVDECKECHYCCSNVSEEDRLQQCKDLGLPRNLWCEATDANKQCKIKDSLVNATSGSPTATVTPLPKMDSTTVSADVPTGGNTTNQNSTAEPSKLKPSHINNTQTIANLSNDAEQGSRQSNISQQSQHGHSNKKHNFIAIGCASGAFVILVIVLVVTIRHFTWICRNRTQNYDSVEQGEIITELKRTNDLVNKQPNSNGRESPSSENQSTTSFSKASTESIHSVQNEAPIHEDTVVNLDVQRIPEERIVSDMEWLRDEKGNLMLFFVQKQLDPVERAQKKTWRSIGLALSVSSETLDLIDTCYKADKSPTEDLVQHLRNRADGEPSMRKFVEALRTCERHDVARSICNWPWELEENRERQAC